MLRLATLPQKLLRSFSTTASASSEPLTLYQYKICPFCCKTKSILSHLSVPFKTVEVNPLNKRQFKDIADVEPLSDYRKVPVAVIEEDGQKRRVDGSDVIIQHILDSTELPGNFANESGMKWLKWSDDHLAPRIYPLLTETFSSSLSSFSYLDDVKGFSTVEKMTAKYVGALAMVMAGGKIKKKYNITDCQQELDDSVQTWVSEALDNGSKKFEGGDIVSVGDAGVYGVFKGLEITGGGGFFARHVSGNEKMSQWYEDVGLVVGDI